MAKKQEYTVTGTLSEDCKSLEIRHYKVIKRVARSLLGQDLMITFTPLEYQRSGAQNRWYWGCACICIAGWYRETQGETITKEAVHDYVLQHVIGINTKKREILGKTTYISEKVKTTSKMSVKDFNEFKEKLQAYFAEYGCIIPDPRDNNMLEDFIKDK